MKNLSFAKFVGCAFFFIFAVELQAQDMELPYHQIPDHAETYSAGNIVSRMIDGLGYRYYWATEGLTENRCKWVEKEKTNPFNYSRHPL